MTLSALLVALLVKPALLVATAWGVTAAIRRTSAAARHAVWTGAIAASVVLPLLGAALPDLRWRELEVLLRPFATTVEGSAVDPLRVQRPSSPLHRPRMTTSPSRLESADTAIGDQLGRLAFALWLAVAAVCVARRSLAEVRAQRLARAGWPASARVTRLCAEMARRVGVAGSVSIRVSDDVASPAVAGILRPTVLLPPASESWATAELEAVLVHEFGHVVRRDCLFNLLADLASGIYWCNPLVRFAAVRVRREGERSCDDMVLRRGADAGTYAELLLRVARSTEVSGGLAHATTAMSRATELEARLIALLDARVSRAAISRAARASLGGLGILLALPAAAITVGAGNVPLAQSAPEPDRLGDSLASPSSERVPVTFRNDLLDRSTARALAGPDSMLAHHLVQALAHVRSHEADLVRERAAWALSRVAPDGRLVEPLLEALGAPDWRVQSYAAWSLALSGDARAGPPLIPLVRHPVWRLRAMAAYALRASGDPRAVDAMTAALSDPAWQVRVEAVEYLAELASIEIEPLLRARLDDRHIAVRLAAQRALNPR